MSYTDLDIDKLTKNQIKRQRKIKFKKIFKISFFVFLVLFIVFGGFFSVIAYTDFRPSFVSKDVVKRIKVYFALLPFVPKTREQVALATVYRATKVKSFTLDASGAVTFSIGLFTADFDLKAKNFFDIYDKKNIKSKGKFNIDFDIQGEKYKFELDTIIVDGKEFLRIKDIPSEIFDYVGEYLKMFGADIDKSSLKTIENKIVSTWIRLDKPNKSLARKELENKKREDMAMIYKDFALGVIDDSFLKKFKFSKQDGKYVFYKEFNGREFISAIQRAALKEGKVFTKEDKKYLEIFGKGVDSLKVNIEIEEKTYYLNKFSFVFEGEFSRKDFSEGKNRLNREDILKGILEEKLSVEAGLTFAFSEMNVKKPVKAPEDYVTIDEFFDDIIKEFEKIFPKNYTSGDFRSRNQGGFSASTLATFSPSESVRVLKRLVSGLEEYRSINGVYPGNLVEYFKAMPDREFEDKVYKNKILYYVSSDKKKYLAFVYYRHEGDKLLYAVAESGEKDIKFLPRLEVDKKIDELDRKNVLGSFMKRLIPKQQEKN